MLFILYFGSWKYTPGNTIHWDSLQLQKLFNQNLCHLSMQIQHKEHTPARVSLQVAPLIKGRSVSDA